MSFEGIAVSGNTVRLDDKNGWEEYQRFRKLIVDGGIPVTMPIAVRIATTGTMKPGRQTDGGFAGVQEPMLTVAQNVANILFIGAKDGLVCTEKEYKGVLDTGSCGWCNGCIVVKKGQYMCSSTESVSVRFVVRKTTGHQSMAENAEYMRKTYHSDTKIKPTAFFPLISVHTLFEYISVLPYIEKGGIRVRYHNGMTAKLFQQLLEEVS